MGQYAVREHTNSSRTAESEGRTEDKTAATPVGGIATERKKEEGSAVLPAVAVAKDSGKRDDEHTK